MGEVNTLQSSSTPPHTRANMDYTSADFLFQTYAVCMLMLFFIYEKAVFGALNPHDHLPEDDHLVVPLKTQYDETPADQHKRKNRIFLNALENIPFHAALFTGALFVVSQRNTNMAIPLAVLLIVYTVGRAAFHVFYALGMSGPFPFRSLSIGLSMLATVGCLGLSVAAAFSSHAHVSPSA